MTEYALTGPAGEIATTATGIDPSVKTREGWRWLPLEDEASGPFDEATEVREPPALVVAGDKVVRRHMTRPKSAAELAAETEAAVDAAAPPAVLRVISELAGRIARLDGGPAWSEADAREAVKAAL